MNAAPSCSAWPRARDASSLAALALGSVYLGWLMAGRRHCVTVAGGDHGDQARQDLGGEPASAGSHCPGRRDEGAFADTIDELLARLEGAFAAQRAFAANASHELRTPLAAMRVSVDVATRKPGAVSDDAQRLAGRIRAELDEAEKILESLLVLARANSGGTDELGPVSLAGVATDALHRQAAAAADLGLTLRAAIGGATVTGNRTLLERMVSNLLDNAVRHNEPGGFVDVAVE